MAIIALCVVIYIQQQRIDQLKQERVVLNSVVAVESEKMRQK